MDYLRNKYSALVSILDKKQQKYIHSKSVNNFISHLERFPDIADQKNAEMKINEYLEFITTSQTDIDDALGIELFDKYVSPLGTLYKTIGFMSIVPLKYLLIFSLMIDSLLYFGMFKYPYPIATFLVCLYYLFIQKKYYVRNKVYGIYY
jgi:hypothetical protein